MFVASVHAAMMRSYFVEAMAAMALAHESWVAPREKQYSPDTCVPPERMPVVPAPEDVDDVVMAVSRPAAEMNENAHTSALPRGPVHFAGESESARRELRDEGERVDVVDGLGTGRRNHGWRVAHATGTSMIFPQA